MIVEYSEGIPSETGIYACRVPAEMLPGFHTDMFLMWDERVKRWFYIGSDQKYRGAVHYFIGPLRRTRDMT